MSGTDFEQIKTKLLKINNILVTNQNSKTNDIVSLFKSRLDLSGYPKLLIKGKGNYEASGVFCVTPVVDKFNYIFYIDVLLNKKTKSLIFYIENLDLKIYGTGITTLIHSNGTIISQKIKHYKSNGKLVLELNEFDWELNKGRLFMMYPFIGSSDDLNSDFIIPKPIDNEIINPGGPSGHN